MFRAKNELCAGSKIPYPTMKVFKKKISKKPQMEEVKQKNQYMLFKEIKDSVSN